MRPVLEVVVESHSASVRRGLNSQPGNQRREPARSVRNAIPVKSAVVVKHVAPPGDQCSAEGGIDKIFLRQFPGDDFAHLRLRVTQGIVRFGLPFPRNAALTAAAADRQGRTCPEACSPRVVGDVRLA